MTIKPEIEAKKAKLIEEMTPEWKRELEQELQQTVARHHRTMLEAFGPGMTVLEQLNYQLEQIAVLQIGLGNLSELVQRSLAHLMDKENSEEVPPSEARG